MGTGINKERDLVNWFKNNYKTGDAFRLAASGGGSTADLPDVFATVGNQLYVIEQKYAGRGQDYTNYVEVDEQLSLWRFAQLWGAKPLLVFRFSYDSTWYTVPLDTELHYEHMSESGTINGKRKYREDYVPLEEIVNE